MHASSHFDHDESTVYKCEEFLLINYILGKHGDCNMSVFVFHHRCPQVNVLHAHRCISGGGVKDGGVDVEFSGGDFDCGSSKRAVLDDTINPDGLVDAFCFVFGDNWRIRCAYMLLFFWIF